MKIIAGIKFRKPGKVYFFDPGYIRLKAGDKVIVETSMGEDIGEVVIGKREIPENIANAGCCGQNQHGNQKILCLSDGLRFHCIGRWLFNIHSKFSLLDGIISYFGRSYQRRKPSRRSNCARRAPRQNASHRTPIKTRKSPAARNSKISSAVFK